MWRGEHPDTARLVTGDVVAAVQALKDEPGDELQIWGSGKLLQTLLQHELVDRFRLMTFPLVIGSGRRLFNDGIAPATMRAVDLTTTELGIVSPHTNRPVRFARARCNRLEWPCRAVTSRRPLDVWCHPNSSGIRRASGRTCFVSTIRRLSS